MRLLDKKHHNAISPQNQYKIYRNTHYVQTSKIFYTGEVTFKHSRALKAKRNTISGLSERSRRNTFHQMNIGEQKPLHCVANIIPQGFLRDAFGSHNINGFYDVAVFVHKCRFANLLPLFYRRRNAIGQV